MGLLFCSVLSIELKDNGKNGVWLIITALYNMSIWDVVPIISVIESEPHHPQFIT